MRCRALIAPIVLAAVLALTGCAGSTGTGTGPLPTATPTASMPGGSGSTGGAETLAGSWQLISGTDAKGTIDPGAATVTFTFNGASSGGHGPCNSFGAKETGSTVGPISITVGIHTEMACVDPDLMTAESRYFAALGKVDTARIASGRLTLSGTGYTLLFARKTT